MHYGALQCVYLQHESMTTTLPPPSMMATFHHVTEGSHLVTVCYGVLHWVMVCVTVCYGVLHCMYLHCESKQGLYDHDHSAPPPPPPAQWPLSSRYSVLQCAYLKCKSKLGLHDYDHSPHPSLHYGHFYHVTVCYNV